MRVTLKPSITSSEEGNTSVMRHTIDLLAGQPKLISYLMIA
jgi:hypothetical protein